MTCVGATIADPPVMGIRRRKIVRRLVDKMYIDEDGAMGRKHGVALN